MLETKLRDLALGKSEVRQVYRISTVGPIAGAHVTPGKDTRDAKNRD